MSGSFNVFEPPTLRDVKVGYISTDRGYVSGVGLWDANVYAKKNPGTTFIFSTREKLQYLNINEVNKLTPDDLPSDAQKCSNVDIFTPDSKDADPRIIFAGGGGVGAVANPIIGQDGSLLGVDLISGGFGYKYPPQVSIQDPTGISAGAVIRCGIGSTAIKWETYEDEDEFEDYFPPHIMALAPPNVGFGSVYSNGKNIGAWNPNQYINPQETPFEATVKRYMKELREVQDPWWTTGTEAPNKVTGNNKTTKVFYKVKHGVWSEFLNSYAISPVPMSRSKGSDFPGRWYTFEWEEVEFPYDGEYKFTAQCDNDARFFLDNEAVSEFKIGAGGAAGSVLSNPLQFKETIKGGKHNLRLELYNHAIKEKVSVQGSGAIKQETKTTEETVTTTRQEIQVAGADFMKKSNGYYLAVGGNEETELVLKLDYNDNPRTAGTAITKLTIPNTNGPDLVLEREKDSNGRFKQNGSVSTKGIFRRSELGYGPFILEGNDGSSRLTKVNVVYGPNSDRYGTIEFLDRHGTDTNGSLTIISAKNLQQSRTVETTEVVKSTTSEVSSTKKLSEVFNTVDFINKANRKLWRTNVNNRGGFMNEYGICPFDTLNTLPDNPYAGTHEIKWNAVNFPVSGNYIIEIGVDDNVTLQIGDQVEVRKEGYTSSGKGIKSTGILKEMHYIKQGTYNIVAALEQIPGGKFGFGKIRGKGAVHDYSGKGLNPMALAVNITTVFKEEERTKVVDWHYNPMGVAMSIQAPAPPIPQQPKPVAEGRCPANPFWTTRFPGGTSQWHPVFVDGWSKFLNKYAMSPVPPYDTESTSGGGFPFDNEWTVDIPYDGFYKLKGSADDISTFFINGTEVLNTSRSTKVQDEKKIFLSKGSAKIRVVVENYLFEEKQLIDQQIFNTANWVNSGKETPVTTKTIDFKVTTSSAFINSIDIKGLFYEQGPSFVGDGESSRLVQLNTTVTKEVEVGKEYIVEVKNAGQGGMGNYPAPIGALKADGGVLMLEDIPNVPAVQQGGITFDDLVCTASQGRFYDITKNRCKFKVERQSPTAQGTLIGGTVRDGVIYEGPKLATYARSDKFGAFISPYHTTPEEIQGKTWLMKWNNVTFPETGQYSIEMEADDILKVRVDGKDVGGIKQGKEFYKKINFNIATKGSKTLELELTNLSFPGTTFKQNPVVAGVIIRKKMNVSVKVDGKIKTKSWKENPVGVSGILIPPPCPQVVGGKGVVEDVRPICPGNGFKPPTGPGYPVGIKLKRIEVDTPGINYNADDPVEIDGPATAHICEMDSYGRVKKVCVDDTAGSPTPIGITNYPRIRINSPTGSGFRGIPVTEIVRDPIVPDPDKLLQVTDLVGIKQTGYYEGRPYYGAIFYKEGVKYAGYYETAGQLVQIYDTLQESIDAQVTTPASAILRQGTDISSDNPRLDIPGTPDNLT